MRALAGFVLRGRWTAVGVMVGSVIVPLLFWLSIPALSLVALRRGLGEGVLVAAASTAVLAAGLAATGAPAAGAAIPLVTFWGPALVGAGMLRATVSWPVTLQVLAIGFTIATVAFHLVIGDAAAFWSGWLTSLRPESGLSAEAEAQWQVLVESAPAMLTGALFATMLATVVASLLLARWWQALLFNPGGFRSEFHALRLSSGYAAVAATVMLAGAFTGPGAVYDAGLVLGSVFALQGLAVVHAIVAQRKLNVVWLVLLYTLLLVTARLMVVLGLVDVFVDLRRRLQGPANRAG